MKCLLSTPFGTEFGIGEEKIGVCKILQHTRTKDKDNSMYMLEQSVRESYYRLTQPFQPL